MFGKPMKTSDLLVAALENEGVEYIFALPGDTCTSVLSVLSMHNNTLLQSTVAGMSKGSPGQFAISNLDRDFYCSC